MSNYKISVIIPVYNVEKYIDEAMNSLLKQTIGFENLEVIFADDCSTDISGSLIDDYAKRYPNVTAIHLKKNSGAAGIPRNEAMKLATAEYLMFLDPDDYYTEEACTCLYEQMKKSGHDLVSGYYSEINEAGELLTDKTKLYEQFEEKTFSVEQQYSEILKLQNAFWCKIYKRSVIIRNEIEFPPHIPGQDTVFLCRYLLCCKEISYIDHKIACYRLREKDNHSISNRCNLVFFIGIQTCYRMIFDYMADKGKADYFVFIVKGLIDFYIMKLLDSDSINEEETNIVLNKWKWIFDYCAESGITCESPYSRLLLPSVLSGDFGYAVNVLAELKIVRKDFLNVITGRDWLADQQRKKDTAITEMQNWSKQQDAIITELQTWSRLQEDAKNYHAEQAVNFENALLEAQKNIEAQNETIEEKEKTIEALMNQNKKLTFYLKEEINKPWHKKMIQKSRESDYKL